MIAIFWFILPSSSTIQQIKYDKSSFRKKEKRERLRGEGSDDEEEEAVPQDEKEEILTQKKDDYYSIYHYTRIVLIEREDI